MKYAALFALLLMVSTAFGLLIVDWSPPDGTITLYDTWNQDVSYGRGCNSPICDNYPPGVDGQVTVNFTNVTDAYEGQAVAVAGLENCWITDCELLDKTGCPACPYVSCEAYSPDNAFFNYGDPVDGSSVDWTTIEGTGDQYDTHLAHELWTEGPGTDWSPSWPTLLPQPNEGVRTIKAICADKAGNIAIQMQDDIYGDFVDPYATISYSGGYQSSTSISITQTASDQGRSPPPDPITHDTQRDRAVMADGVLGAWEGWSTIDTSGTNFNWDGPDCYGVKLRYRSHDVADRYSDWEDPSITVYIDTNTPGAVGSLTSTSHPLGTTAYANQTATFTWSDPQPCSGTQYYATAVTQSSSHSWTGTEPTSAGTSNVTTGLAEGTWYFHIRSRNNAGTWGTADSFMINVDLGAPTPNPATVASVVVDSDTQVTVTATTATDAFAPIYYRANETTGNSGGTNFTWQTGTSFVDGGLAISTQYCYIVQYKDKWDNEGAWTTTPVCDYSNAAVPGAPTVTLLPESSPLNSGLTMANIVIDENGNPATVLYNIKDVATGLHVQADGTLGASAAWMSYVNWGGSSGIDVTLEDDFVYSFAVKANGGGGDFSAYGPAITVTALDRTGPSPVDLTATADIANNRVNLTWPWASDEIAPDIDSGLVGHWELEDNTLDSSGNGHDGTNPLGISWVDGIQGQAGHFVNGRTATDITTNYLPLTVSFWVKEDANTWESSAAIGKRDGSSGWMFYRNPTWGDGNLGLLTYYVNTDPITTSYINYVYGLNDGNWHHIAFTIENGVTTTYKDGVLNERYVMPNFDYWLNNSQGISLGSEKAGSASWNFDGYLDDMRVYDRLLTEDEIKALTLVGQWHFDEGTGTDAFDASGFGNDGTITGATWADGVHGSALDFDGAGDYIDAGTGNGFKMEDGAFTFEAMVKSDGGIEASPVIMQRMYNGDCGGSSNSDAMRLGTTHTAGSGNPEYPLFWVRDKNGNSATATSTVDINDGKWHHVAGVRTSSTIYIYVDGVETGTASASSIGEICPTNPFVIGRHSSSAQRFNGKIDEARVWRRALTASELQSRAWYMPFRSAMLEANYDAIKGAADDFSDGDYTSNPVWTPGIGGSTWGVENGQVFTQSTTASESSLTLTENIAAGEPFVMTVDKVTDWAETGIHGGGHYIRQYTAGNYQVSGVTIPHAYAQHWRLEFDGTTYRFYLNDELIREWAGSSNGIFDLYDDRNAASGKVYYDNVKVYSLQGNSYEDTDASDTEAPDTPGAPTLTAYSTSILGVAWTGVSDTGNDWFHFVKAFDTTGNEDNYHPSNGLVSYWPLGDGSTGSADGAVTLNRESTDHGTVYGATWVDGEYGSALDFDGADDYVTIANTHAFANDDFSYTLWFKADTPQDNWQGIMLQNNYHTGAPNTFFVAAIRGTNDPPNQDKVQVYDRYNGINVADYSDGLYTDGEWHHLAVTYDRDGMRRFYIDGAFQKETDISPHIAIAFQTAPLQLGRDLTGAQGGTTGGVYAYDGSLDEILMYSRVLTPEEVAGIYHRGLIQQSTVTTGINDYYVNGTSLDQWYTTSPQNATSLGTNTRHCYNITARDNALNVGNVGGTQCNYTLAVKPSILAGSMVCDGNTSSGYKCDVPFSMGDNPLYTEYYITATSTDGGTGFTDSGWITVRETYVDTGLDPHKTYCYKINARNGDGTLTGQYTQVCKTVANNVPTLGSATGNTDPIKGTAQQTLTIGGVDDLDQELLYIHCCTDEANTCTPTNINDVCSSNDAHPYSSLSCSYATGGVTTRTEYVRCVTNDTHDVSTPVTSDSYLVDSVAPTTTDNHSAGSCNAVDQVVSLSAGDDVGGVGVDSTLYCVDTANTCNPVTSYSAPVTVTCSAGTACTKYLRYNSSDVVDNQETVNSAAVQIDKSNPDDGVIANIVSLGTDSLRVTATAGTDDGCGNSSLQYYFTCQSGACNDGTWQSGLVYDDSGLSPATEYCYSVKVRDDAGNEGADSADTCAYTDASVPTMDSITAEGTPLNSGIGRVEVNWSGNPAGTDYEVQRDKFLTRYSGTNTAYTDTGLDNTWYCYRVRAQPSGGSWSGWSNELCTVTLDRTGPSPPNLTATPDNVNNRVDLDWTWANDEIAPDIDSGMVGHWRFEEGSGIATYDSSGSNIDGTIVGTPQWVTGLAGNAVQLDNSYINLGDAPTLDIATELTLSMWVKPDAFVVDKFLFGGSWSYHGYSLRFDDADNSQLEWYVGDGSAYHFFTYPHGMVTGKWYNIVCTYDGTEGKVFVNGNLIGSRIEPFIPDGAYIQDHVIGTDGSKAKHFTGTMDDVRVYNRALTDEEVKWLTLVGQWHFDEGTGTDAFDATGFGNDGSFVGDPAWTDGVHNTALEFDGSNYVSAGSSEALNPRQQGWTAEMMVKSTQKSGGNGGYIRVMGRYEAGDYWLLRTHTSSGDYPVFQITDGSNSAGVAGTTTVTDGVWHHLAFVYDYDDSRTYIYIDGVEDAANDWTGTSMGDINPSTALQIGQSQAANEGYSGKIDEVRVWRRALTAAEIQARAKYGLYRAAALDGAYEPVDGLWDDFDGAAVDTATWTELTTNDASITVSNSEVTLDDNTGIAHLTTQENFGVYGTLEFDLKANTPEPGSTWYRIAKVPNTFYVDAGNIFSIWMTGGVQLGIVNDYEFHNWKFTLDGTHIRVVYDGNVIYTADQASSLGTIRLGNDFSTEHGNMVFKNVKFTPLISTNTYQDTGASDTAGPNTPAAPTVLPINSTAMQASWSGVGDVGTGWWHYVKAFDSEGNEDNYHDSSELIGYWPFSEGSTGSADGVTTYDSVGTNEGTVSGAAWATGAYGTALDFTGGNTDKVALATPLTQTVWSTTFWARQDAGADIKGMIMGDTSNTISFIWFWEGSYFRFRSNSGTLDWPELTDFTTMAHYALVSDGVSVTLYKNGVQVGSPQTPASTEFTVNAIGQGYNNIDYSFDGVIDEVMVYDRVLTDDEVVSNYKRGAAKFSTVVTGLQDYYVNETTGNGTGGAAAVAAYNDTSLTPNGYACYEVRARDNANNWGLFSSPTCNYTLAVTPGASVTCSRNPDHCNVTISPNGNAAGTEYNVNNTQGGTDSGWITASYYDDTSVSGQQMCYKVRARNANGIETNESTEVCDNMPNTAPTTPVLVSPTNGAIVSTLTPTLDWQDSSDNENDSINYEVLLWGDTPPSFTITNFNNGAKTNTTTDADRYGQGSGLELDMPYAAKDANLVSYWRMEGDAVDEAGPNHGTITEATPDAGKFGSGLHFDGSNDKVTIQNDPSLNPAQITVASWFNPDVGGIGEQKTLLMKAFTSHTTPHYQYTLTIIDKVDYEKKLAFYAAVGGVLYDTGAGSLNYDYGEWHLATGTYDGGTMRLYLDDQEVAFSDAPSGPLNSFDTELAFADYPNLGDTSSYQYGGVLDEMKIYDRPLTGPEVTELFNNGNQYKAYGYWESETIVPQGVPNKLSITHSGLSTSSYIDKVEWLVSGQVKATYGTDVTSGSLTEITTPTSGSFDDVDSDYKIRIYLAGDGTATPTLTQLTGEYTSLHKTGLGSSQYIIQASEQLVGGNYSWKVKAHDSWASSGWSSTWTFQVQTNDPVLSSVQVTPAHPTVVDGLGCSWVITDVDFNDTLTADVTWKKNGAPIATWDITGMACQNGQVCTATSAPTSSDIAAGEVWTCVVTAKDAAQLTDEKNDTATILKALTVWYTDGTYDTFAYTPEAWDVFSANMESTFQGSCGGFAPNWWNTNWPLRIPVDVTENTDGMSQYQVKVELDAGFNYGATETGGSDIRFADDAKVPLPYWIETWNPGGTSVIWVKADLASGPNPLWMYYGNAGEPSESDGTAVFISFDDGEAGNLVLNPAGAGSIERVGGRIYGESVAAADGWLIGTILSGEPFIAKAKLESGATGNGGIEALALSNWAAVPVPMINTAFNPNARFGIKRYLDDHTLYVHYMDNAGSGWYYDAVNNVWADSPTNWKVAGPGEYTLMVWDDGINYNADIIEEGAGSVFTVPPSIPKSQVKDFQDGIAIVAGEPYTSHYYGQQYVDDWRIRKHVDTDPSVVPGGEESGGSGPGPGSKYVFYSMKDIDETKIVDEVWFATKDKWQVNAITVERA
ncbi:DUF2341 domain-containing protein [archaeon]